MYKRVLLKLSGEALAGASGTGIDPATVDRVVNQLVELSKQKVQIGIVVGGGNFWRGRQGVAMNKVTADHMGMLATIMNSLALQDAIEKKGVHTRVQTALSIPEVAEPFILRKALHHFECGRVVIFACGTGNPYFTTDSGAALRAAEIKADVILMAKNVDGVYDSDPKKNPEAKRYEELTFMEVLNQNLGVMDMTAASFCKDRGIPWLVFSIEDPENIVRAVSGEAVGTLVK